MVGPDGQHYRILSRIGEGGFGEVYHAQKIAAGGFRKDVALKMLNAKMAGVEDVAHRLKDEARILGLLNHRAIVKVDLLAKADLLGRGDARWTVVMEYVEGVDLKQLLEAHGRVPLFVALEIGAEVTSALDYAYNHEVVDPANPDAGRQALHLLHRDIKPSNIQLTAHGDVKVLDFGIARAEFDSREAVTRTNFFLTREYAAPERLRGVEHPGGDVFSLGAVLYELITGQRLNLIGPYIDAMLEGAEGFSPDRYRAARTAEVSQTFAQIPGMSEPLSQWLLGTLAWSPEQRPPARQLKKMLKRFAALAQGEESLSEWCERVVGPLVEQQRAARARAPAGETASLAGQTLVTDGHSFRLLCAQTDVNREQPLELDNPTSAESMEATRWEPLSEGSAAASEVLPTRRAPAGHAASARQGGAEPVEVAISAGTPRPPDSVQRPPVKPLAWAGRGLLLIATVLVGVGLGLGAMWYARHLPDADATGGSPRVEPEAAPGGAWTEDGRPDAPTEAEPEPGAPGSSPRAAPGQRETTSSPLEPPSKGAEAPRRDEALEDAPSVQPSVPEVRPKPPEAKPEPRVAVSFVGDQVRALIFVSEGDRYEVGAAGASIPPGAYFLRAVWSSSGSVSDIGELTVRDGERLQLRCVEWTKRCVAI